MYNLQRDSSGTSPSIHPSPDFGFTDTKEATQDYIYEPDPDTHTVWDLLATER